MIWELLTVLCVTIWICFKKLQMRNSSYWSNRNVPYFDRSKLISNWDFIRLKYKIHETVSIVYNGLKKGGLEKYAGVIEFGTPTFFVLDPDLIKTVLVKDFDSFVDRRVFDLGKAEPLIAKMLISTKGQAWKDLRSTMTPTFTTGKIRRMYSIFSDSSDKLSHFLKNRIRGGDCELDLRDPINRYTLDVIASAAFGLDSQSFSPNESEFVKYTKRFQNQFTGWRALKFMAIFLCPNLIPRLGISISDQEAINFFSQVIKETIKHRETTGKRRDDYLQLLMEARNPDTSPATSPDDLSTFERDAQIRSLHSGVQLTEDLIIAQSLLFFTGGFDSLETLVIMTCYELALNSEVQEKLYKEVQDAVDNNGKLCYDLTMKLEYLDQVVSETLRKYPTIVRTERKSTKPYQIPGSNAKLETDTLVVVPIYGMHMDEQYYPNPNKFEPERFTAENKAKRNPYTYIPFGAGPRNCVAMRFSLAEGKAAIAHLILNFKLEPSKKTDIPMKFKTMGVFKPVNGLWLRVTPRN